MKSCLLHITFCVGVACCFPAIESICFRLTISLCHFSSLKLRSSVNINQKLFLYIYAIIYIWMIGVILVLPHYSAVQYNILAHTTSQLGSQHTPNAWIMNLTFILLGIGTLLAGWRSTQAHLFSRILLLLFGVSLSMTGIFRLAPIDLSLSYNTTSDGLHSMFATTAGFAFSAFAVVAGFHAGIGLQCFIAISMATLAILLSLLMNFVPEYAGLLQRTLFITAFGWFIFLFGSFSND